MNDPYCTNIKLSTLLQLIWHYTPGKNMDNGLVLDTPIGRAIYELDPGEEHCHIEFPNDRPKLCHLYAIKDWRNSLERRHNLRKQSEFERQDKYYKLDLIKELADKLIEHDLAGSLPFEMREVIAKKIILENNTEIASRFGITDTTYRGEINVT